MHHFQRKSLKKFWGRGGAPPLDPAGDFRSTDPLNFAPTSDSWRRHCTLENRLVYGQFKDCDPNSRK